MLTEIGSIDNVEAFVERVKAGKGRLQGFGHRVYKNYDPRATIIKRDRRRGVRGHRQEPAARHRAQARRGRAGRRVLHQPQALSRTSTSTRASSTRRWASRSRCSRCCSPSPARPAGWRTGWSCSSRTPASPGPASSTSAPGARLHAARQAVDRRRACVRPRPDRRVHRRALPRQPRGVCFLDREPDEEWMQSLAAEMNLSETAFLFPPTPDEVTEADPPTWRLRWFTPIVEVALCGHATLASAHYLFTQRKIDAPLIRFLTKSGLLTASRTPDDFIELDFPADHPTPASAPAGLLAGLGLRDEMVVATAQGRSDILVEVADANRCGRSATRRGGAAPARRPGSHRHVGRYRAVRHRVEILRAGRRHRRGPRHRIGAHDARALFGRRSSARTRCWRTSYRPAAAWFGCWSPATVCTLRVVPSRCSVPASTTRCCPADNGLGAPTATYRPRPAAELPLVRD